MARRLFGGLSPWVSLFTVTAAIEVGAGAILVVSPSTFTSLVLGASLDSPASLSIARLCGAALIALGVACWSANREPNSRAARGLIAAMLFYNLAAVAVFAYAGLGHSLSGLSLWPSAALHIGMSIWCLVFLRRK
jgi:hypothetical protein